MKKLTLFLVATLFSALSFALNPYAYGLTSSLNPDQTTLTVNYSLNADATSATFVLLDGDKEILSQALSGTTKGTYTATVKLDRPDMPLGKKLSWRIDVKGAEHNTTTNVNGYRLYHPSSVDVDNNPESPNFGRILCNEAMNSVKSKTDTYLSAGFGAGIFAFNPAFEPIANGDKPGFNGGNDFVNTHSLYGSKAQTAYVTRRIRISDDGRIFLTSLNPTQDAYLWEVNPDDLNDWKPIFQYSKKNSKYDMEDASGNFVAGPNVGFDVRGTGDNLQLLMLSANINGMQFNQNEFKCFEYDLGTNTSWNKAPSRERKFTKNYAISFTGCQVQYDNEGGVWLIQYRTTSTDAQPALVHINANGEQDYIEKINNFRNAGFRFNHDFTKVITADGRNKNGTYTEGFARIYNVSKDANGKPVLEYWKVIDLSNVGKDLNDFAWDIANNIYVVGHNSEWIRAYALARTADDIATTPCASKYEFTINSAAQMDKASELNPYAYNLTSTFDNTNKVLTINYTLNANANSVDIVIKDGNLELKRIACSGKTRGSYTEVISVAGDNIPLNRKLSWSVEVKGTTKSVPTQVSTYYSLYCPHGLAIDKDPNSEYFGRILAAEGMQAVPASGYLSSSKGAGLYAFTPEFATDGKVYDGGLDFTRQLASNGYQPWRVKISEDGRIFVSSCDLNKVAVWEVSKDLSTWTKLIYRPNYSTSNYKQFTANGEFYCGPNVSMDVKGSGDNLKLLLYSTSKNGIAFNQSGYSLDEYAIGTSTDFTSGKPTHIACLDGNYGVAHTNVNVIYDGEGGYWFGASRGGNANQPNLVHFDKNGNRDYYSESDEFYGGDGVLVHNGMLFKGKKRTSTTEGNFGVYTIGKDASGNIKLTEKWAVKANHIGRNLNEFAVDFGENLYVVGNSGEKIIAFALPYSGTITTPCATQYEFTPLAGWVPSTTSDLNPFAYGLSSELIDGGKNVKINYSLNAPANSAKVVIMNGTTEVKLVPCTDLTKGVHSITIPTEGLPMNTDLTWKMVVNGTSVDKVMEYATKHKLYHPSSVDIDNNPENETFGLVLVNEAMQSVMNTTSTKPYISKGFGAGIFAFDPAFKNTGKYNGGITFTNTRADNADATAYAPRRIRISDDGRIFVTSLNTNGDVLWEVNPENMNEWTPIFTGLTQDVNKDLVNGNTFVAGPNAGFDVRGSGENLQLLMLSGNTLAFGLGQRGFRVSEYNLGTNTSWNTAPSKAFPHENLSTGQCYFINPTASQVQYDKDGGVWYIQYRAEATELLPTLVHFNKNGVEDFKWLRDGTRNAAFRFNNDFTKVAISDAQFVNFYTVSKDGAGKPALTWESGFSLATLGNAINDFAWDYANNFYAVSNSNEWAVAYRLPYDGEITTPAASTIRVVYDVVVSEDDKTITTTLADYENKSASVELKRDLHLNEWNTLTLPFGMDAAQIEEAFGVGTRVAMLTTSRIKAANSVYIGFSFVNQIEAGKPYLINPTKQVTEDIVPVIINTTTQTISTTILDMIPVLDEETWKANENNFFLGPDAYLYQDAADGVMPPLRAYFQFHGLTSQQLSNIRARVAFGEDEATDLEDLEVMDEPMSQEEAIKVIENGQLYIIHGGVKYNIQGQVIR